MEKSLKLEILERCETEKGELQLQKRGHHYEIISNGLFLTGTYHDESERSIVKESLKQANYPKRILIGGLGVGITAAEALKCESIQEVVIVEAEQHIINWNRTYLAGVNENALNNKKLHIVHGDVRTYLQEQNEKFDMICLNIDKGPDWIVFENSKSLYGNDGLKIVKNSLNAGGYAAYWSTSPSGMFYSKLQHHFPTVKDHHVKHPFGRTNSFYFASCESSLQIQ